MTIHLKKNPYNNNSGINIVVKLFYLFFTYFYIKFMKVILIIYQFLMYKFCRNWLCWSKYHERFFN